ncbi:methyltransferase [Rickenella mellea]|uniref:tRNA N(3)-methylcytidine methyltransferase n=1 Tax=Rickenella mellea TaxID=50990 RepID=A0A4Y7Q8T2_9AGAM|nr:methyltransferase [Rickenella mellea]
MISNKSTAEPPKTTSSVHDINAEKPPFGSRFLTEDSDIWSKNAWDHVPLPEDQSDRISSSLSRQRNSPVPDHEKPHYNDKPARHWDNFYKMNSANFFRNRKWLHTEFPELVDAAQPEAGHVRIAEIGCGAGNSVFPLLSANLNPELELHAFDYSNHAVKLVQNNPLYISPPVGKIHASVWDLSTSESLPQGIQPGTVDIVVLIFVLSALHPNEWPNAIANIYRMLKPGGSVVLRDYGRHDLTQLRFKEGRLLDENFYVRGDKTRVYFFELDDLALLFTGSVAPSKAEELKLGGDTDGNELPEEFTDVAEPDLSITPNTAEQRDPPEPVVFPRIPKSQSPPSVERHPSTSPDPVKSPPNCPARPLFSIEQLGVDRRLLVNRKRQLKMYRVWMQGKFRKLLLR